MDERNALLEAEARRLGADLFGVADLSTAAGLETNPADLFTGFRYAVMIGVKLADAVVEQCVDGPTPLYEHHYEVVNAKLDQVARGLAGFIEEQLGLALPLPASKMLDAEALSGHVSHKALGRLAGLGWQGKSLLLVSPQCGPRFRMAAVLTDLELEPGEVLNNRCGSCTACTDACPSGAIKDVSTETHYGDRDEALEFSKCADMCLKVFAKRPNMSKPVCGVCVQICPWGQRKG